MFPIPGCRRRERGPRSGEKTQAEALGLSHDQEGVAFPKMSSPPKADCDSGRFVVRVG